MLKKRSVLLSGLLTAFVIVGGGYFINTKFSFEAQKTNELIFKNNTIYSEEVLQALKKENYKVGALGLNALSKSILITINDSEQSINNEREKIEFIVSELSKETMYKDYSVEVLKMESLPIGNQFPSTLNDIFHLLLVNLRADFNNIDDISVAHRSERIIVNIKASILSSDESAKIIAKDIEQKVLQIVKSKEAQSLMRIKESSLEVKVYSSDQKKIN
ncbi:hypothetical protein [Psychrobacillus vulpis]|uniref:DUF4030 domain-containing protein n=1 Tax=Psychrobacillus vulpis TaxID=2325572 RepID=A0A544TVW2_9BACI|nr:hypothetical protein [Psychrobacillus vulpis]TQR21587.1 hypothetical protein FG384_01125 [Psychrobacillus vulpis]